MSNYPSFKKNVHTIGNGYYFSPVPEYDDEVLRLIAMAQSCDEYILGDEDSILHYLRLNLSKHHTQGTAHTWIIWRGNDEKISEVVGTIDIQFFDYHGDQLQIPLIDYWVSSYYRGKGLCSVCLPKCTQYYQRDSYQLRISIDNYASMRVAQKCGFYKFYLDESADHWVYQYDHE